MAELVSTVIPTYNYGRFLGRAIDSVLGQSYRPIECIVVDDGSTDNTAEVLSGYRDRVRIIRQRNRGLSAARNAGIRAAHGQYIALLDADDWWHPEKTARQVSLLQKDRHLGCVGCGRRHVSADGQTFEDFVGLRSTGDHRETFRGIALRQFWVGGSGSGAMIRRSALDAVGGFDESLKAAEDWDLWLRLAAATRVDNVPEVLSFISLHGTGSFRNVRRMEEGQWAVYTKVTNVLFDELLTRWDYRRMRALIHADAAGECLHSGDSRSALRYYTRSLATWPFSRRRWNAAIKSVLKHLLGPGVVASRAAFPTHERITTGCE
jgi:glycosyltransferase involved in cell wall biosynthesis